MSDKSALKILVVDDEPFILKLHERTLANLGFNSVTTCASALHALEIIDHAAAPPDLILLDLNMPDMDGVEFVRYLVKRDYPGSLILLSGEDERVLQTAEKLVHAHQIPMLGHMRKPVKREELGNLLQKWTPTSKSRQLSPRKIYTAEEVRSAIVGGELVNHYQPMVSLSTGHLIGTETLVRWRHPLDGLVLPFQFIDVAEQNGLIRDLTHVVINNALAQASAWNSEMGLALQTTINVSMDDLGSLDFADYIGEQAAVMGISPQQVTLEVTESQLMQDRHVAFDVLTRLRLKRFRISIDDFGTGHSSLAQLRDIPFDELKIDRGFVHGACIDRTQRAIFNMSVILAKQLNMSIVTEGVEDRADWDFVRRSGCDIAQGYFIAKPMPAEDLRDWIKGWEARALETNTVAVATQSKHGSLLDATPLETLVASIVEVTKQREQTALEDCLAHAIARLTEAKSLTLYRLQPKDGEIFVTSDLHLTEGGKASTRNTNIEPFALSSNAPLAESLRKPYVARIADETGEIETKLILPLQGARGDISAFCQVENTSNDVSARRVLPLLLELYTNFLALLDDNERDMLTGLLNRKTFDLRISKILPTLKSQNIRSADKSAPDKFCLATLDIDHFKHVNDTFGHVYGDEVLLLFSNLMKKTFRDNDLLFRFGGEEFVVLLATTDIAHAPIALERFRAAVENYKFPGVGQVTVSIGVALISSAEPPRTTLDRADQALYFAKQNGRNQIRSYEDLVKQGLLKEQNIQSGEIELF
ncbi:MAG TPA: EAL domain-containing protein [Burkholderiales bacterium]|nr:EAL domain-containing protein [Burkholderiales bacterium]